MSSTDVILGHELMEHMEQDPIKAVVEFLIVRPLRNGDYKSIQAVVAALPNTPERVKVALFYLIDADWNLRDALFHIELDAADRDDSWVLEDSDGHPAALQSYNIELARDLTKCGDGFNADLLEVTYRTAEDSEYEYTVEMPAELRECIDVDDQNMIEDINRWRRANLWHYVGPDTGISYSQGEKWHPLQEVFVRNRFALADNPKPDFQSIYQDYVAMFSGFTLPGRVSKCGPRSQTAITSFLHREVIDNANRVPVSKSLTRDLRYIKAKSRLRAEWQQKASESKKSSSVLTSEK